MNFKYSDQKLLFLVVSVVYCFVLSLRPLPSPADLNDTGRYLYNFFTMCKSNSVIFGNDVSNTLFNLALSPICIGQSPRIFLFATAIIVPLGIFIFSEIGGGKLFILFATVFNAYQFEFMTNALRQNLSFFFLLFALYLILCHRKLFAFLMGISAVLMHSSNAPYLPFILFMIFEDYFKEIRKKTLVFLLISLFITLLGAYFLFGLSSYVDVYKAIYAQQLGIPFLFFILSPHFTIYGIRYYYSKNNISNFERWHFFYSSVLYLVCYILFPAIVYRLPMTLALIQLFLISHARRVQIKEGVFIMLIMSTYLIMYFVISSRVVEAVFFIQSNDYI